MTHYTLFFLLLALAVISASIGAVNLILYFADKFTSFRRGAGITGLLLFIVLIYAAWNQFIQS
jgi:hypothetical protein